MRFVVIFVAFALLFMSCSATTVPPKGNHGYGELVVLDGWEITINDASSSPDGSPGYPQNSLFLHLHVKNTGDTANTMAIDDWQLTKLDGSIYPNHLDGFLLPTTDGNIQPGQTLDIHIPFPVGPADKVFLLIYGGEQWKLSI